MSHVKMLVLKSRTTLMKEIILRCEGAKPLQASVATVGVVMLFSGASVTGTVEKRHRKMRCLKNSKQL